jgi:tetratricopeptide (TPR) repeat protein
MMLKKPLMLAFCLVFGIVSSFGQTERWLLTERRLSATSGLSVESLEESLKTGIALYSEGKFTEAADQLRYVAAISSDTTQVSQALYWISLAELSAGDYARALEDLSALEKFNPGGELGAEIPYHRGRVYYYQGRYEDAIVTLSAYLDSLAPNDSGHRVAALYWIGECLYSLGQLDKAGDVFALIVEKYPESVKYEAASYRLDLINQKKIEAELLSILKWTHEESLKTLEEYQRREKSYDQAIVAYQKRISEMLGDTTTTSDPEPSNTDYEQRMGSAAMRIAALEASLAEANAALEELRESGAAAPEFITPEVKAPSTNTEKTIRLLSLKAEILELRNTINSRVNQTEGKR